MFDSKCQPELHLIDVWYQMSTRTASGWCLISIINRWLLVHDWSYTLGVCFLCISGYLDSKKGIQLWHFFDWTLSFLLVWKNIFRQTSTKTVPGWCLISNINQNSTWLMFDSKCQPELHLVDVWYQMSTRTLSGWCLISIINRVATGSWLIFIYSSYMFSLHFRVCRLQKRYTILTLFWLDFVIFACMKKHFSSNIQQNCTWLMFDIKRQPKLYLVDVW